MYTKFYITTVVFNKAILLHFKLFQNIKFRKMNILMPS